MKPRIQLKLGLREPKETLLLTAMFLLACACGYGQDYSEKRPIKTPFPCWVLEPSEKDSTMHLSYEYSYEFLNHHIPKGSGPDFQWAPIPDGVNVIGRFLVRSDNGRCVEFYWSTKGGDGKRDIFQCVLLARETKEGWLRPVFVAQPEENRYTSELIATSKNPLALTVEMTLSGSGAMAYRWLFDLRETPRLITHGMSHRVNEGDFRTKANYDAELRRMMKEVREAAGQ